MDHINQSGSTLLSILITLVILTLQLKFHLTYHGNQQKQISS